MRERSSEPAAVPISPPAAAANTSAPSARFCEKPWKCALRSRNARKKTMKPANARTAALAHIASATTGPTDRSRPRRLGLASWSPRPSRGRAVPGCPRTLSLEAAGPAGPGPAG